MRYIQKTKRRLSSEAESRAHPANAIDGQKRLFVLSVTRARLYWCKIFEWQSLAIVNTHKTYISLCSDAVVIRARARLRACAMQSLGIVRWRRAVHQVALFAPSSQSETPIARKLLCLSNLWPPTCGQPSHALCRSIDRWRWQVRTRASTYVVKAQIMQLDYYRSCCRLWFCWLSLEQLPLPLRLAINSRAQRTAHSARAPWSPSRVRV